MSKTYSVGEPVKCLQVDRGGALVEDQIYRVRNVLTSGNVQLFGVTGAWAPWRFNAAPEVTPEAPPPAPTTLPTAAADRKAVPLARGLLDYFPAALAAVAHLSKVGNDQHNPGETMHHARSKSTDHADCILRHLMERGSTDTDGISHSTKAAWRALALLQEELEAAGAPLARGAKL